MSEENKELTRPEGCGADYFTVDYTRQYTNNWLDPTEEMSQLRKQAVMMYIAEIYTKAYLIHYPNKTLYDVEAPLIEILKETIQHMKENKEEDETIS